MFVCWPWAQVHLDLAGPFIGHNFLVLINSHSKWMEVHPLSSTTSLAIIQCLEMDLRTVGTTRADCD